MENIEKKTKKPFNESKESKSGEKTKHKELKLSLALRRNLQRRKKREGE